MPRTCFRVNPHFASALSKEFLDILAAIEFGFTLKRVRDMTRAYSQIDRTNKYSKYRTNKYSAPSLVKWLSVLLRTKWFWVRVQLQSLHLQISHLLRARSSLTFMQLQSVDSLWNAYVTWQEPTVQATNEADKNHFKLLNNALYGKTIENMKMK